MNNRIQIASDVHCEFHRDGGIKWCQNLPVIAPILSISGDFATDRYLVRNLSILCERFEHVIFVCGNHEYYGSDRGSVNNNLVKLSNRFSNFHWLNNSTVEINGQRFIGGTMWFKNDPLNWAYEDRLSDFRAIIGFKKWVYEVNKETLDYFNNNLKQGDYLITHHAPCSLSISEEYTGSPLNRFFVCDISEMIREKKPAIHQHGHTHTMFDYQLYDTRVVCNPYGFPDYEETNYNELFVVEV